jgi:hypothetical protein
MFLAVYGNVRLNASHPKPCDGGFFGGQFYPICTSFSTELIGLSDKTHLFFNWKYNCSFLTILMKLKLPGVERWHMYCSLH